MSGLKPETAQGNASIQNSQSLGPSNPLRENFFDAESAKIIARKLFDLYDLNKSGVIESHEVKAMLFDAYGIFNRTYVPVIGDEQSFIETHDRDGDGKLTLQDLEEVCLNYLCKSASPPEPGSAIKPSLDKQHAKPVNEVVGSYQTFGGSYTHIQTSQQAQTNSSGQVQNGWSQSNQPLAPAVIPSQGQQPTKVQTQSLTLKSGSNSQSHYSPLPNSTGNSQNFGTSTTVQPPAESLHTPRWTGAPVVIRSSSPQPLQPAANRIQVTTSGSTVVGGGVAGQIISQISTTTNQVTTTTSSAQQPVVFRSNIPQTSTTTFQPTSTQITHSFGPTVLQPTQYPTTQSSGTNSVPTSARGVPVQTASPLRASNSNNTRLEGLKKDFEASRGHSELERVLLQANTQYLSHKSASDAVELTNIHPVLTQLYQLKHGKAPQTQEVNDMTRGLVFNPSTGKIGQPELQIIYLKYMLGIVN